MSNKLVSVANLLRVRQYYKSLLLFIGIFFAGKLFEYKLYPKIFLAFILVSLCSSLVYILNDIKDIASDKIHPIKKDKRPLANGEISINFAYFIFIIIGLIEIYFIIYFKNEFSILLILIFLTGTSYNYIFKNIAFADIIVLSTNYIWRALAGCFIIDIRISPWLIITIFLIALFLASGKRIADLTLIGKENANQHKKIYDQYSSELLNNILVLVASALFIVYTLYCVLGPQENDSIVPINNQGFLVFSTPLALYIIIRFMYLTYADPKKISETEKIFTDKGILIGLLAAGIIILITIYLEIGDFNFSL